MGSVLMRKFRAQHQIFGLHLLRRTAKPEIAVKPAANKEKGYIVLFFVSLCCVRGKNWDLHAISNWLQSIIFMSILTSVFNVHFLVCVFNFLTWKNITFIACNENIVPLALALFNFKFYNATIIKTNTIIIVLKIQCEL